LIHLFPSADPLQSHIRRLQVLDGWRLSQTTSPYTEWQHFVVLYGTMRLLLNFSLRVETTGTTYRLLALIGNQEGWSGDVIEVPAIIRRGAVDSLFGDSSIRLVGEGYRIHIATPWLHGDLLLEPQSAPLLIPGIRLDDTLKFHWLCVPRLVASGRIWMHGHLQTLERVPAYHDHNWGRFSLLGNFAWEWGFVLPEAEEDPWSAVFLRVSDRARHRCRVQGLALWRDGVLFASFRDGEVSTTTTGVLLPEHLHIVPPILSHRLNSGGSMPRLLSISASRDQDYITLEAKASTLSCILLPHDENISVLREASATIHLHGRLRGRSLNFNGLGMLEVVDGDQ